MRNALSWVVLTLAILMEVAGTTSMKLSNGFTHLVPSIFIFVFYFFSFLFLTFSLKWFELGFAYAVWSGLGTLVVYMIGVLFFLEPFTFDQLFFVFCIIVGVIGLKNA